MMILFDIAVILEILCSTFGFFQGLFIGVFSYIVTPRRIEGANPIHI